ncbi:MAG: flagellar export protein FliJ [Variovorax sp.]|nr:MAG: flagellar export protein FliJ [Variovorax sp.]
MPDSKGLKVALDLATTRRDAAARALAQVRQQWLAAQIQLDQLESYAQESLARWTVQSALCTPELMRHHYQFMDRLGHAITLQTHMLREHGQSVEHHAVTLREAEARVESLRQLIDARQQDAQRLAARRDQKVSDEQASMLYRRHAGGRMGGVL